LGACPLIIGEMTVGFFVQRMPNAQPVKDRPTWRRILARRHADNGVSDGDPLVVRNADSADAGRDDRLSAQRNQLATITHYGFLRRGRRDVERFAGDSGGCPVSLDIVFARSGSAARRLRGLSTP